MQNILLITPPLTQLNTPYPATAALKGFLQQLGYNVYHADLGIELINAIFSKNTLTIIFNELKKQNLSGVDKRTVTMQYFYVNTIDTVMQFLQGKNPNIASRINTRKFLPEGPRFKNVVALDKFFGKMGTNDQAKYLATLYIQDIADLIRNYIDAGFDLIRYKEQISQSAATFTDLHTELNNEKTHLIDDILLTLIKKHLDNTNPEIVGFTVPFPGNLYGALKSAQYIKNNYPKIKTIMGGGYVNTELRQISDVRIFEFIDYLIYDAGEQPFVNLLKVLNGELSEKELVRTSYYKDGQIIPPENGTKNFSFANSGTPDFTGLPISEYISLIETVNPMHKMWTDGYWNKMTLAHGCYWAHCAFCDTSLDYIKRYEPDAAEALVNKIEAIINQTGQAGFHFTDEAAPPGLLKSMAIEILKRQLQITWWGNIRFEQAFTPDLCRLLAASGCIAVTGGIETASDRLLKMMNKGVTIEKAATVTHNFLQAGIMVHAYLMFGFPSQTIQETIDSLEIVRQFFELNLIQSGFWHRFALTCHSPVAEMPERYGISITQTTTNPFANNEISFFDPVQQNHPEFGPGLNKAIFNYMHQNGFDIPLNQWFDFKIPKTTIPPKYVKSFIKKNMPILASNKKIFWIGGELSFQELNDRTRIFINTPTYSSAIDVSKIKANWFKTELESLQNEKTLMPFNNWAESYFNECKGDLETEPWFISICKGGLLIL